MIETIAVGPLDLGLRYELIVDSLRRLASIIELNRWSHTALVNVH